MGERGPLVSIGLPVYNGENHLEEAIESVLVQTCADIELIISDNASMDSTEDICRRYEQQDQRIRYIRQPRNLGAAANYNLVFARSSGRYFKWLAHDDAMEPRFIEACVEALESDPTAVLACPVRIIVDGDGRELRRERFGDRLDTTSPSGQFASILTHDWALAALNFSLLRRDAVARTRLYGAHYGSDWPFLAELAVQGSFRELDEELFVWRRHDDQFGADHRYPHRLTPRRMLREPEAIVEALWKSSWWNTSQAIWRQIPYWRRLRGYLRAATRGPLPGREKARALRHLARWTLWARRLLARDLVLAIILMFRRSQRPPAAQAASDRS